MYQFLKNFRIRSLYYIVILLIILSANPANASSNLDKTCNNIIKGLEVNTGAYKSCLYKKPGEKYSQDELTKCKNYYLQEVERLSYIFKNICR